MLLQIGIKWRVTNEKYASDGKIMRKRGSFKVWQKIYVECAVHGPSKPLHNGSLRDTPNVSEKSCVYIWNFFTRNMCRGKKSLLFRIRFSREWDLKIPSEVIWDDASSRLLSMIHQKRWFMNCKLQLFNVIKFAVCLNSYSIFLLLGITLMRLRPLQLHKHLKQILTLQN